MATNKFVITAGFLVKDEIKRQIKKQAFLLGIDAKIEEVNNFLSTDLQVTLEGENDKIDRLANAIKNVIETENHD